MTQRTALCGTTAILFALAGTAQADVTGADVWNNWKAAAESVGQVITPGSETQDGNTLTLSDIQISMSLPEDKPEVKLTGSIEMISFSDNGDGTVAVNMSPGYTMVVDTTSDDSEDAVITIGVAMEGMAMTASGDPGAITYDFLANSMAFNLDKLVVEDEEIPINANAKLTDIDGKYLVTQGDMTQVETEMTAAEMVIDASANEPGGDGTFVANVKLAKLAASSSGSLIAMADPAALSQALANGMSTASELTHGGSDYMVDFKDDRDQFAMSGTSTGGSFAVSMDADALSYKVAETGTDFRMSGSEIPLPEVALQLSEFGLSFLMPVSKSETPGDFAMNITLRELAPSEMIWMMLDGGSQLPHDPATLVIDLAGKANWLIDIFDPEGDAGMAEMDMPGELHALDINELQLKIAGAELTGNGGFTFNMKDLSTFDGMPAPTGALDLKLVGGNGLMDKLVAMGLLPEDQAMGARMMLGLFARPGDGPDTLTSKIEVDGATGAVSANGQRLQ